MKNSTFFVFDLDGTLVDTITGISVALNETLKEINYKKQSYTKEEVKNFVGGGSERLFRLATNGEGTKEQFERFLENYVKFQNVSEPYEGVVDTLKELNKLSIQILIYSNKPHDVLLKLVEAKFKDINFLNVQGNDFIHPPKPDVTLLKETLKANNLEPKDGYYIGDSKFDVVTSKNIGMKSVIMKYGYGNKEDFIDNEPDYYLNEFKEIMKLL